MHVYHCWHDHPPAGAFRFWRQQNALMRGRILAGGWEIYLTWILYTFVSYEAIGHHFVLITSTADDIGVCGFGGY